MNHDFAREVGYFQFLIRKAFWHLGLAPKAIRLPTGVTFPLPSSKSFASDVYVSSCNIDWGSEYILARFMREQAPGREFLDVGAHIGYYSALLSPFASRVFAFEPDIRNHPYLSNALAGLGNATLVSKAVGDSCGTVAFSDKDDTAVNHIDPDDNQALGNTVGIVTIDSFVRENGLNPIAVKIDIEGYDILALRGAVSIANNSAPVFLVEYNQEEGRPNTWAALQQFTGSTGYNIFCVSRVPKNWRVYTYSFSKRMADEMPGLSTKMLFLVPAEHLGWFERFSAGHTTWCGGVLGYDHIS